LLILASIVSSTALARSANKAKEAILDIQKEVPSAEIVCL
jgi:hypothetical protein